MLLFLNTSNPKKAEIAIIEGKTVKKAVFKVIRNLSEKLLPNIQKFLKKNRKNIKNITKISAVVGPGSFMGVRTGIAVANALAFSLNVDILGVKSSKIPKDYKKLQKTQGKKNFLSPIYNRGPGITKPKSKL